MGNSEKNHMEKTLVVYMRSALFTLMLRYGKSWYDFTMSEQMDLLEAEIFGVSMEKAKKWIK